MENQIKTEFIQLLELLNNFKNNPNLVTRKNFISNLISITFKIDDLFCDKLLNKEIYNKFCIQLDDIETEFQRIESNELLDETYLT